MKNVRADADLIFEARNLFVKEYCLKRGWIPDANKLTWDQIMEIRKQDGWRNPKVSTK